MQNQIKKAVIPAAGLGTRFLPATKTVPKELLPIVDIPTILLIAEEAVQAGIEDIILVSGRQKSAIEDLFDISVELEQLLETKGEMHRLDRVKKLRDSANFISIRQKQALGLGHAVNTAYPIIGNQAFAVLLGDEIMVPKSADENVTLQLAKGFAEFGASCVSMMAVPKDQVSKYGILKGEMVKDEVMKVEDVVEKPAADKAPSNWALPGRYVFSGQLFDHLKNLKPGRGGEIQLTDGMTAIAQSEGLFAQTFSAKRYDAGDKLGYLKAQIEFGLDHPETAEGLKSYLKDLSTRLGAN